MWFCSWFLYRDQTIIHCSAASFAICRSRITTSDHVEMPLLQHANRDIVESAICDQEYPSANISIIIAMKIMILFTAYLEEYRRS